MSLHLSILNGLNLVILGRSTLRQVAILGATLVALALTTPAFSEQIEIRAVQSTLSKMGCYDGSVDGRPSLALRTAIRCMQKRAGLTPSGSLDEATIEHLKSGEFGQAQSTASMTGPCRGREGHIECALSDGRFIEAPEPWRTTAARQMAMARLGCYDGEISGAEDNRLARGYNCLRDKGYFGEAFQAEVRAQLGLLTRKEAQQAILSAKQTQQIPYRSWNARLNCISAAAPMFIELKTFIENGELLGYLQLRWYKNNQKLRDDQNIILDLSPNTPGLLDGSTIFIADDPFNDGVTGTIAGQIGGHLTIETAGPGWQCPATQLTERNLGDQNFAFIEYEARVVREARSACTASRASEGPTPAELDRGMRVAAASLLCNPTNLTTMLAVKGIEATGLNQFVVVDDACQARMLNFPIMNMVFEQVKDQGRCELTAKGEARCIAKLQLLCETVDAARSGIYCPRQAMPTIDATSIFRFHPERCKWLPTNFKVIR